MVGTRAAKKNITQAYLNTRTMSAALVKMLESFSFSTMESEFGAPAGTLEAFEKNAAKAPAAESAAAAAPAAAETPQFVHIPQRETKLTLSSVKRDVVRTAAPMETPASAPVAAKQEEFVASEFLTMAVRKKPAAVAGAPAAGDRPPTFSDLYESVLAEEEEGKKSHGAYKKGNVLSFRQTPAVPARARAGADDQAGAHIFVSPTRGIAFAPARAAQCEGGGDDEQHVIGKEAGVEALKRAMKTGTPTRISVKLGRADSVEIIAKRSAKDANSLVIGTRLNQAPESDSRPVQMLTVNMRTGAYEDHESWVEKTAHSIGDADFSVTKTAYKVVEELCKSAGVLNGAAKK